MTVKQNAESTESKAVILPYDFLEECYIEELGELKVKSAYLFFKRAFDIVFSLMALLVLAIPMLLIALLVKCTSHGKVFYCQERLGLGGKKINVIKFRTMCVDAEKNGAQWSTGEKDPRITPVGRFLRNTRLDELPQFWCILKGEMSVVGPRPEREVFYDAFEQYIHGFRERLKVKPGLTGLAQVNGGYFLKPEKKILYDIEYIKTRSMWLDIKIIFQTVLVVLGCADNKKKGTDL
ncbi:MAG: sugar transferase [Clostridia bacterium]|nr:sugar transferase [Clostridia bacterium]